MNMNNTKFHFPSVIAVPTTETIPAVQPKINKRIIP